LKDAIALYEHAAHALAFAEMVFLQIIKIMAKKAKSLLRQGHGRHIIYERVIILNEPGGSCFFCLKDVHRKGIIYTCPIIKTEGKCSGKK